MPRNKTTPDWMRLQQALDGKSWGFIVRAFSEDLATEGISLSDLPVRKGFAVDDTFEKVTWFTWWTRERVANLPGELAQKYREKRFTEVALHAGGEGRSGELRTIALLTEAKAKGLDAVAAVLMLALLGSPDLMRDFTSGSGFPMQLVKTQLDRWAHDQLNDAGIDAYWHPNTNNRLPPDLFAAKEVRSLDDYIAALAARLGEILRNRVPVALTVSPAECIN
jgi:hypothetical protein